MMYIIMGIEYNEIDDLRSSSYRYSREKQENGNQNGGDDFGVDSLRRKSMRSKRKSQKEETLQCYGYHSPIGGSQNATHEVPVDGERDFERKERSIIIATTVQQEEKSLRERTYEKLTLVRWEDVLE